MRKRGIVVLQFNWLYVMIVGGLILIFFVMLANNIRKSSNESLNYDILTYMDEIFTGIETSAQVEHNINLPGVDIEVSCQSYGIKSSSGEGNSLQTRSVFSPDLLKTEIRSYTLYWEAPFKTSFFLFLTSSEIDYAMIDDGNHAQTLYDELPDHINKRKIGSFSEYQQNGSYKIRFITFDMTGDTIAASIDKGKARNADISLVNFHTQADFPNGVGGVDYYIYDGNSFVKFEDPELADQLYGAGYQLGYFNKASVLGAVFAQGGMEYDCNMAKSLNRLSYMSEILIDRIAEIKAQDENGDQDFQACYGFYEDARDALTNIKETAQGQLADTDSLSQIYEKIYPIGTAGTLEYLNNELQRKSCPMVY